MEFIEDIAQDTEVFSAPDTLSGGSEDNIVNENVSDPETLVDGSETFSEVEDEQTLPGGSETFSEVEDEQTIENDEETISNEVVIVGTVQIDDNTYQQFVSMNDQLGNIQSMFVATLLAVGLLIGVALNRIFLDKVWK